MLSSRSLPPLRHECQRVVIMQKVTEALNSFHLFASLFQNSKPSTINAKQTKEVATMNPGKNKDILKYAEKLIIFMQSSPS